jgi:hypothetical protein
MPVVQSETSIIRKNSAGSDFRRRRINLIEGSNVTLTVADDSANNEIDVTIAASGSGGGSQIYYVVGAADADYITDGTADDVEIQAALDAANSAGGGTVFLKKGTYAVTTVMTIGSNTQLIGEEAKSTIIQKGSGLNSTIFNNKDTTNGNSYIAVKNLTIDQQGSTQTGGGGISMTGLTDSVFENVIFEQSRVFNLFIGSLAGTAKTGTITATSGDSTVTGSSTLFTSELAIGSIIKTAGGRFGRVASITSDTALELDRAWGHSTEAGVTYKLIPANARNKLINCQFKGTTGVSDNVGLGLFDDSLVQGCTSTGSTGYGLGPDHTNRTKFIGNTLYSNSNAGIGLETCGYCVVQGNVLYRNAVGVYLLSGAYRNVISGNECYKNTNGIAITYNSTSFPMGNENHLINNICEANATTGINVDGVARTVISGNRCANNGSFGIRIQTGNSVVPDQTLISNNTCYDNQDTKTQARGIYVLNGTGTFVLENDSLTANHTTTGLTDSGTGTVVINTNGTTNAAGRTNLGLAIGTDVQAFDSDLTVIAGLVDPNADRILFWDDSAGAYAYLTAGTGLSISGTTITSTGSAAGSDTQVQFNDGGTALGGDAGLTYNKTSNVLTVGTIPVGNGAGTNSLIIGVGNTSSFTNNIAIGTGAVADGDSDAIAIGSGATASENNGIAIGFSAASGTNSDAMAIGTSAGATGLWSVAIGKDSDTSGEQSVVIGRGANSSSLGTVVIGVTAHALAATKGVAIGYNAAVDQADGIAIGNLADVDAVGGVSIGQGANVLTGFTGSIALGKGATASAANQLVIGDPEDSQITQVRVGAAKYGILSFSSIATSDKTFTFPNTTGTVALVDNPTDITVPDEAYGSGWNGVLEVPTKNAIYDKIEDLYGSSLMDGYRKRPFISTDYSVSSTSSGDNPFLTLAIASGTAAAPNAGKVTAHHPGVMRIRSSTTTNSGIYSGTNTGQFLLAGGEVFECILNPDVFTDTTTRVGFHDTATSSDAVDGAYIEISTAGVATGKTSNNSNRTSTGTTYTMSTGTWYRIKIVVNSNATQVDFFIYDDSGTQLWTNNNTANIPTSSGRECGAGVVSTNVGVVATDILHVDYLAVGFTRILTR